MIAVVEASKLLKGEIDAPPSKSYTHRAIIAASLAQGSSRIKPLLLADDITATINACKSFGVSIVQDDWLNVTGQSKLKVPLKVINCGDSGSTIRFFTPIAALVKGKTVLDGSAGLRKRPLGPLIDALKMLNVQCESNNGYPPVTIVGGLKGGKTSIVGDVSSQFVTGLLFACPMAEKDIEITVTTPLESKPYVKLTLDVIKSHGVKIEASRDLRKFSITGGQHYRPKDHNVPGDFSSAAFLLAAATLTGSDVTVKNLYLNQPDSQIVKILSKMGVPVKMVGRSVRVKDGSLKGRSIDAKDIPDLVPVCTVLGCLAEGETRIYGAKRLRLKESDRLSALPMELLKMGADIVETDEGLIIHGPRKLHGAKINPHNDHRIAMACAVAGLTAMGKTEILEAECVDKSYPNFFDDLKKLGANINVG